jgi:hypothetical protein
MIKRSTAALFVTAIIAAALPAHAVSVALFNNGAYVDYNPGAIWAEASNLEATLQSQGSSVMTFTGITAAAFTAAVVGKQVLAIPELENGNLDPDLDAAARAAIANFVNGGGRLLVFVPCSGDPLEVLNSTFGFTLTTSCSAPTPITLNGPGAAGTRFAGGPPNLPWNNATDSVNAGSLPSGARIIYMDSNGDSTVTLIPVGAGEVIIMGWDWFDASPTGSQDGGWLEVLRRATGQTVQTAATPAPTMSVVGLAAGILILLAFGMLSLRQRGTRTI